MASKFSKASFSLSPKLLEICQDLEKRGSACKSLCNTKEAIRTNHHNSIMLIATQESWELWTMTLADKFWITFGVLCITSLTFANTFYVVRVGVSRRVYAPPPIQFDPRCVSALLLRSFIEISTAFEVFWKSKKFISEYKSKRAIRVHWLRVTLFKFRW